ncbi:MAG TPA: TIGR04255 family protein [Macromonas sp.]|nr:TIGR04255 family protein [Macromonas sp.]
MTTASVPFADGNAIEYVTFAVRLAFNIDPAIMDQVDLAFNALGNELPGQARTAPMPANFPQFSFGNISLMQPVNELTRFHAQPNGVHTWRVTVQNNVIAVTCHQYTDHREVFARAQRYFGMVLGLLPEAVPTVEVSLQFVDKFKYNATIENIDYDMRELFRPETDYLTEKAWNSDLLWHVYQGWFDQSGDQFKVLNQLNLSNIRFDDGTFGTVIDHRLVTSNINDGVMEMGAGDLPDIFNNMHTENIGVIRNLLTDEKLFAIGMGREQ